MTLNDMTLLSTADLFATRDDIKQAYQFADESIQTLNPEDRMAAYTAAYVLYNTAVNHYNKQLKENEDA